MSAPTLQVSQPSSRLLRPQSSIYLAWFGLPIIVIGSYFVLPKMDSKNIVSCHSQPLNPDPGRVTNSLQDHFNDKPIQEHGSLWNQLWQHKRTSWDRGGPSIALRETLVTYPELFDGTYPDLGLLSDFVGHGLGQQDTSSATPATIPRKKALVPACGTGYDAVLLAKVFGYDVVGLEISSTALDAARKYLDGVDRVLDAHTTQQQQASDDDPSMRFWIDNQSSSPGRVHWVSGDFFSDDWLVDAGAEKFDLIFDYTVSPAALPIKSRSLIDAFSEPQNLIPFHS